MAALDEIEAEKLLDRGTVDLLGPTPIEVDHGFGGADVRVACAPLEAAFLSLALFDGEHFSEPGLVDDLVAAADQPKQAKGFEAGFQLGRGQISGHSYRLSLLRRR